VSVHRLPAWAKLTLSLRVHGRRPDGYHPIEAEMVELDLADELTVDGDGDGITVTGPYAAGVPTDATNLVARALELAGRRAAVRIDKQVPHGGGLGGGSADAAAVLRWCGIDDPAVAVRIGADVAFCTVGGRARVTGIGEQIDPLAPAPHDVTLVIPPLRCSTAAVYAAWDELGGPTGPAGNDLEPAAIAVEPRMATWRDRVSAAAGSRPQLAGSGATWFLRGHHAQLVERLPGAQVVLTRTRA
jgi:4-diphosphocytidyl-2-C-methyl-D-erythritol kinase